MTIPSALPSELTRLVLDNLREVPDFPQPGVLFRDITPLLADGRAFATFIEGLAVHYAGRVDAVAGLESRGFILAAPLAVVLGVILASADHALAGTGAYAAVADGLLLGLGAAGLYDAARLAGGREPATVAAAGRHEATGA